MRCHQPWWAMIFYYTHDITEEMGPTAIIPGTQYYEKFAGEDKGVMLPTGKAGTMVLVHFDIWHRASLNLSPHDRYMLKFQFIRLHAPTSPSWNHQGSQFVPPQDTPAPHLNMWQNIWDWMRGETGSSTGGIAEPDRLEQLRAGLDSPNEIQRIQAADELGQIGEAGSDCSPALSRLLHDPVEAVALNAAYALGKMGTCGIQQLLDAISMGSKLESARASYGIQVAGEAAVDGLAGVLQSADEYAKAYAAFALGGIGAPASKAVPTMIAALQDQSEWVRRNIIEALGMIGDPVDQIVPALVGELENSLEQEKDVQQPEKKEDYIQHQHYIINKVGYTATLSLLRVVRPQDAKEVLPVLEKALQSRDRYIRAYAFEVLTHLKTPEAVELMIHSFRAARWCPDTNKHSPF